jgi:hypothetical protein
MDNESDQQKQQKKEKKLNEYAAAHVILRCYD